ncbi:hypothetical protein EJ03DRAFT_28351 [Teratosphaeria nubilosa]|uniref:Uncharacterized protein n=1 Tax=Teratosphaeria nubilosa TaxID=161662 RepID=A0A6G1KVQ0_9PEZI|nr:hypothetical protein EJ03DRAFT_28351 [Teratosphaeria nubilosa]
MTTKYNIRTKSRTLIQKALIDFDGVRQRFIHLNRGLVKANLSQSLRICNLGLDVSRHFNWKVSLWQTKRQISGDAVPRSR